MPMSASERRADPARKKGKKIKQKEQKHTHMCSSVYVEKETIIKKIASNALNTNNNACGIEVIHQVNDNISTHSKQHQKFYAVFKFAPW